MTQNLFNRDQLEVKSLKERENKLTVKKQVDPDQYSLHLSNEAIDHLQQAIEDIRAARERGAARILTYGAHSIKNGLSGTLIRLIETGWITHLATNGAGMIHDWEFAFQGETGENVERYTEEGQFGIWEETGKYLNLALISGAWRGFGYGESIGRMILDGGIEIETEENLLDYLDHVRSQYADVRQEDLDRAAAAWDLLETIRHFHLPSGFLPIHFQYPETSITAAAVRLGVPITCHPMIGHDIIYTHPINKTAALGRAAGRDFLSYADSVSHLEGGIYLSVGSAVMSPMIFEKSLSMSRNIARQNGKRIQNFSIDVVDLANASWDWQHDGEPPQDHPAYYLRFCKTFSRMGGRMRYTSADNRDWIVGLWQGLEKKALLQKTM